MKKHKIANRKRGSELKRTLLDQSLDELEGAQWGPPTYDSALVTNVHRLRSVPLKQYRLEDLRLSLWPWITLKFTHSPQVIFTPVICWRR